MQAVDATPASLRENLKPGDELRIVSTDGLEKYVIFVAVEGDRLKAQLRDTRDVFITTPISSLETIEVSQADARANISWGYGVILFLMLSAVAASNTN